MNHDVVLLPSFAQVEDWRKRHVVESAGGLFSQTVTTFNAWIADLWELHGDGRAIVDSLQRQTIMQAAFELLAGAQQEDEVASGQRFGWEAVSQAGFAPDGGNSGAPDAGAAGVGLTLSPGVVNLAAQCVRDAAGLPAFERACARAFEGIVPEGLSQREAVLLLGIAQYMHLLEYAGLVEVGTAAARLAASPEPVFSRAVSVLVAGAGPLTWQQARFFETCPNVSVDVDMAPGARGIGRVPEGVELRFGFPSGRYAQPALVADLVRAMALGADGFAPVPAGCASSARGALVVVTCADPLGMYKQLEGSLARLGVQACVQAQVPFAQTDFGRQFMQLARVVQHDVWSKDDLADAARPPFSGFSRREWLDIDRALRADRLAQRDGCLASLRAASDMFSQLEELALDPEADVLLGVFEQVAFTSKGRSDAWRAEQLAAASAVRSCTQAARAVGATMRACARVLEDTLVTASYEGVSVQPAASGDAGSARSGAPCAQPVPSVFPLRVLFTTQAVAAQMGRGAADALVLCDLTAEDYPAAEKDDAAVTLFAKLGLLPCDTALARARRTFVALQQLPAVRLYCLRPLNDWDGNPTYPAAVLQELVDAYRDDPTSGDDVDDVTGLPFALAREAAQRGEEDLFANALGAPPATAQVWSSEDASSNRAHVPEPFVQRVALARPVDQNDGAAAAEAVFCPSPSQVESYLECPYKWFAERRLGIGGLDEGFGALERGSFAHAVLQGFYSEFVQEGARKVTPENLSHAMHIMRQVADREELVQVAMAPGSGRYVAADQLERRELETCKENLVAYLDFESRFLPGFSPAHLEFAIRPSDGVTYAGRPFVGTVDRIDVDGAGNAVIVDYKGSVTAQHEIAGKCPCNPGKVQTRMYARAVERALGLRVVGALYVSYGRAQGCAGAYDGRVLEAAHLPAMRHDRCSCALESDLEAAEGDFSKLVFPDMLDRTEELVAEAIACMCDGLVQPAPASADVCRYCPVAHCAHRA